MTEIAQRVAKFLNRAGDAEVVALAESHAAVVAMFVKNYVRGHGFDEARPKGSASLYTTGNDTAGNAS